MTHELLRLPADAALVKRGRGRPKGSKNKPKEPAAFLSFAAREAMKLERDALVRQFVTEYAAAVTDAAINLARVRGIKAMIRSKLGSSGLAEVEAALIVEREADGGSEDTEGASADAAATADLKINQSDKTDA